MKHKNVKFGAALSYLLIILNALYGLVIMPYVLKQLGSSEYGVYKSIASLSASLAVIDMGFGSTVLRYIAKFNSEKKPEKINNYLGMVKIQVEIMIGILTIIGFIVYFQISNLYGAKFSPQELIRAKQLFLILIINMGLSFFENMLFGVISGFNRFIFSNGVKTVLLILKGIIVCFAITIFKSSIVMVLSQLLLTLITLIIHYVYIKKSLKVNFKLTKWDKELFGDSFKYTLLMFLQSIIIQFNGNIDNMVIGSVKGPKYVTVYSFAITIYNMYENLSTAISSVMLPTVTNKIHNQESNRQIENLVISVGRIQFILLGGTLTGFILYGKEFLHLWLGSGFDDCYLLCLILMIPVTVPLIQNVCISILRAKNLMGFRTISLIYSTAINCILTIWGTKYYGYFFAAIGTACSTIIGSIISMNIYYYKKLSLNVFRMFFHTVYKTILAIIITTSIILIMQNYTHIYNEINANCSWYFFIIKLATFVFIFLISLFIIYVKDFKKLLRKEITR